MYIQKMESWNNRYWCSVIVMLIVMNSLIWWIFVIHPVVEHQAKWQFDGSQVAEEVQKIQAQLMALSHNALPMNLLHKMNQPVLSGLLTQFKKIGVTVVSMTKLGDGYWQFELSMGYYQLCRLLKEMPVVKINKINVRADQEKLRVDMEIKKVNSCAKTACKV